MAGEARLQLESVSKAFGGVRALRGVSLDVRAGEIHALVGENGAGKSTLLRLVTGALAADEGRVLIDGRVLARADPVLARRMGVAPIYQQPTLLPDLTVAENLALRLEPSGGWRCVDWRARRTRASALLARVGGSLDVDAPAGTLRMAEQQLVEIAGAVGAAARVLLMDEPTAALTHREAARLFDVMRDLRAGGAGIVYVSHRLEEIAALADRVTVLRDGAHVATRAQAELTQDDMIRLMVGRAIDPWSARRSAQRSAGQVAAPSASAGAPDSRAAANIDPGRGPSADFGSDSAVDVGASPGPDARSGSGSGRGPLVLDLRGVGCAASGLRGIDLQVHAGEIVGLAGLVGAGRTELARVLFGLTPADAGAIRVRGALVRLTSPGEAVACGVAYVPEDRRRHGVIAELSVAANITLASLGTVTRRGWLQRRRERETASHYVQRLAIKTASSSAAAGTLSGGNQQKVALARWLATRPHLLILDEPTQGVDVGAKAEIHALIADLARQGLAILLISSDLPEILGMSDRIVVMHGGRITGTLDGRDADQESLMRLALGPAGARDREVRH